MTVDQLLNNISSRELTEWMGFYNLEPWGTEIEDYRMGATCATIANAHSEKGNFTPKNFIPKYGDEPDKQSYESQLKTAEMINSLFGGSDRREVSQ